MCWCSIKPKSNIIKVSETNLNQYHTEWEENILPLVRYKILCPHFLLSFNRELEALATPMKQGKEIRTVQVGKYKVKLSWFVDGVILWIEKPKGLVN